MTTYRTIRYSAADGIAEILLDRPPVNAITIELVDEVLDALRRAGADEAVRAVILASAHRVFSAGLDLEIVRGKRAREVKPFLERLYFALNDVQYRLGKPSISVVEGAARAGGMTLAVSCDMVIAGAKASFGYPEIDVGLIPALHFVHLPRHAGRHRAFGPLFLGEPFGAEEAHGLGIVSEVVPAGEALARARALAAKLAAKSPHVMRLGRDAFMRAWDADYRRQIEQAAETFCLIVESDDAQEGLAAFVEKRAPRYRGR